MAGARPGSFKKGGGFLNNVDAIITDYEFTDQFPGGTSNKKKSDFKPLYFVLCARQDGADEDVQTTLFAGSADDFTIEDDGKTLTPVTDDGGLRGGTEFATLIQSLCDAGFPVDTLPEEEIDYRPILNSRVRFVQRVNEDKTKRLGKRKSKDGKKEYNRTDLIIEAYYGQAGKAAKAGGKAPAATAKSKASKGPNIADLSGEVLTSILQAAPDNTLAKSKISMKVLNAMLKHEQKALKEDVRKWLNVDENLEAIEGVEYDAEAQTVSLAA